LKTPLGSWHKMTRAARAAITTVATLCLFACAAHARTPVPAGHYLALDGPNTAIEASGTDACSSACTFSLTARHLDGTAATPLATLPLTGTDCPGGDPNYNRDSIAAVAAANEGRVLVLDVQSMCGFPYTGQWSAGPYAGPLQPVPFPSCDGDGDGTAYAVSSAYEARACVTAAGIEVAAEPAAAGPPARTFDLPRSDDLRLALAGDDLAIDRETGSTAHVTVTDLSSGAQLYAFTATAPLSLAAGDDGTVVTSPLPGGNPPCQGGLASHTPSAPGADPLPYIACGQVYLSGGKVIFELPQSDGFTSVESVDLATATVQPITTFSHFGELLAADADHVIALDQDCTERATVYAAPGGGADNPGPQTCPIAFATKRVKATFNLLDGTLEVKLPIRCRDGCPPIHYSIQGGSRTYLSGQRGGGRRIVADVYTMSRRLARACRRYRAGTGKLPVVTVRIRGANRDGSTTLEIERLRETLKFIRR
jgi:hypothetical protein